MASMSSANTSDNNSIDSSASKSPQLEPVSYNIIPDNKLVINTLPNLPRILLSKLHNNPTLLPHIWPMNISAACENRRDFESLSYTKKMASNLFGIKNILPQLQQMPPNYSTWAPLPQRLEIIVLSPIRHP